MQPSRDSLEIGIDGQRTPVPVIDIISQGGRYGLVRTENPQLKVSLLVPVRFQPLVRMLLHLFRPVLKALVLVQQLDQHGV